MMTFRISLPSKGRYSVPRQRLLRASAMMFVVVALLVSVRIAVLRGFEHTIGPDSWGRFTFAIGAALTDTVYGVPGYVIDVRVETFLGANGLTGDQAVLTKLGLSFPANLRNGTLLNSVIERAASLGYPPPPPLRGASGDDLGMVDFVKLSFCLFGYNICGFMLTYFLVLLIEISAFLVAFRNRSSALCILASWVTAHAVILISCLFDFDAELGSVTNPRWLSTLAFLPVLHTGLLMLRPERFSPLAVGMVTIQAICAGFAISIRAPAGWIVLAILLLLGVFVGSRVAGRRATGWRFAARPFWPACVFLLGLFGYAIAILHTLNPVYAEKGDINHHAVWHSILYSLQNFNPYWDSRFGSLAPGAAGDEMPWVAAKIYRERHLPAAPDTEFYLNDHLTLAGLEHYARSVVLEIARDDPSFVLTTFLYYKPKMLVGELSTLILSLDRIGPLTLVVIIGTALWLAVLLSSCKAECNHLLYANIALLGALGVSTLPNILTVATAQVLGDPFIVLVTALASWGLWGFAMVAAWIRNLFRVNEFAAADRVKKQ